jgi:hypothetical protein
MIKYFSERYRILEIVGILVVALFLLAVMSPKNNRCETKQRLNDQTYIDTQALDR